MPYAIEPWSLCETAPDLTALARGESLLALGNGHLGIRGGLDEGEPHAVPGTFLAPVHETVPFQYPEVAYGDPRHEERIVPVASGVEVRLTVDGEALDIRTADLGHHERRLDLRAGTLTRDLVWTTRSGATVHVTSTRVVSLERPALAAVRYRVEAVDRPVDVRLARVLTTPDPGDHAASEGPQPSPLAPESAVGREHGVCLVHRTSSTGMRVAAGVDHHVDGPAGLEEEPVLEHGHAVRTTTGRLTPGQALTVTTLVAYACSDQRPTGVLVRCVDETLEAGRAAGWDALLAEQRAWWDAFWEVADVVVEGDDELQGAIRFSLFHTAQAAARADGQGVRAKGLTGTGYHGHTFWDTETFVLPVLTAVLPGAAADHLRWRHGTLPAALDRAAELGLPGAVLAWRTISGVESSGYWPASTAAVHLGADVADAALHHVACTGDAAFERDVVVDLVVQAARLYLGLGRHHDGAWHLDGVTGPDEYSGLVDDNTYTNLMVRRALRGALDLTARHADLAAGLGVDDEEREAWRAAADAVAVPVDPATGVVEQHEGFSRARPWDFERSERLGYPLATHAPYLTLYRSQVVKQADLVLALHRRGEEFTDEQKRAAFAAYEPLTVRDSSLSAATQAVVAAEVGHLDLAYAYAREAALVDLQDLHGSTDDGLHVASLAGAWHALVAGFGGLRDPDGELHLAPRLPAALTLLRFRLRRADAVLEVEVRPDEARYRVVRGGPLTVRHHGTDLTVPAATGGTSGAGSSDREGVVRAPLPPAVDAGPPPRQPPGRAPLA
ncbi:glycoside hydrolase family 65 protein [Cellulomonas endophytica]|uniref:glycoside hydrolase family 65 protein n=1 Tax=Cellulomonas endophytica TaxID=2494735 RepID=UPI001013BF03|nr:glycosyl hydrolase family 65 protein [Cellulomonas endophytica]